MKKVILKASIVSLFVGLFLVGCGNSSANVNETLELPDAIKVALTSEIKVALTSERSTLNQELINTLSYMGNEERLAYDVYNKLYDQYGIEQFANIASRSEYRHIKAVQGLVQKYLNSDTNFTNVDAPPLGYMNTAIEDMHSGVYDISHIQDLYNSLTSKGSASEIDALEVGCIIEVVDVSDLDNYIKVAEGANASDVITVFNFLRNGSYNHYWAFDRALKNKGVPNGCCSLGIVDGINYCHPEYPQLGHSDITRGQGGAGQNGRFGRNRNQRNLKDQNNRSQRGRDQDNREKRSRGRSRRG